MTANLPFLVVENRQNKTLSLCRQSASLAQEPLTVIASTDAGPAYDMFRDAYVHLSSNSPEFEMICFRRYFLLAQYLHAHPRCLRFVLIDSDVLLFRGIGDHIAALAGEADFSGSFISAEEEWNPFQVSPHVSYWTRAGLLDFVESVLATYTSAEGLNRLREIAGRFAASGRRGGISDMTLLYLWADATGNRMPLNRVANGKVIDHNINYPSNHLPHEFRVTGGAKRIEYQDGRLCFRLATGGLVRVMALHFQGASKVAMAAALDGKIRRVAILSAALQMARWTKEHLFRIRMLKAGRSPGVGLSETPIAK